MENFTIFNTYCPMTRIKNYYEQKNDYQTVVKNGYFKWQCFPVAGLRA